ncbi:MAG: hypothetical protein KGS72_06465 [Cyanobacteria bacterium REEB67]|nr:hypothetical protein [Cyanobacteria bacterium REEB67]
MRKTKAATCIFLFIGFMPFLLGACISKPAVDSSAIEHQTVHIDLQPPVVTEKKTEHPPFLGPGKQSIWQDVEAYTEWLYSCRTIFETETVHSDDTSGGATVGLKVKGVTIKLSLPISVYLPAKARPELKEHEDGHVLICSLVYRNAYRAAREAGLLIVGKTYEGMGKNLDEARAVALSQPEKIIAAAYQEAVADVCGQASEKYDEYCHRYTGDLKKSRSELAKSAYKTISDIPIKVIK